jgi:hypothetical protein
MYEVLIKIYKETIATFSRKANSTKSNRLKWFNNDLKKLCRRKFELWAKIRASKCNKKELKSDYNKFCRLLKKEIKQSRQNYEYSIAVESKKNPKILYSYINNQCNIKDSIRSLEVNGKTITNNAEICEILNEQFYKVFNKPQPNEEIPPIPSRSEVECDLDSSELNPEKIEEALRQLDTNKSPGTDGIHPLFLKECAAQISVPLSIIFKESLKSGMVPSIWKDANVTPIFKKGKKCDPSNYRPISLTAIPCKVFEKIIKKTMIKHLEQYNLICDQQHGFVKLKSCVTNLIECLDLITETLNRNFAVVLIFLDFMKAFDMVSHAHLIEKLKSFGFQGLLLNWIKSFLSNRRQRVVIKGECSSWKDVLSGVPQGSVLGPLLFIIFINDLPDGLNHLLKLFADDSKLLAIIRNSKDQELVQDDLDKLLNWSKTWKMNFNFSKCKVMNIGNRAIHKNRSYYFEETINQQKTTHVLDQTCSERDLGIIIREDLKWDDQIKKSISKANSSLARLKRAFTNWNPKTFKLLYSTFVRPHLEYAAVIWSPQKKQDIKALERVQRRATKCVPNLHNKSYEERLKMLGLTTLEDRRKRGDLIQMYKIEHGFNQIDWYHPLGKAPNCDGEAPSSSTRSHKRIYRQFVKSCPARQNFFSNRTANKWNELPNDLINVNTINKFKNKHDEIFYK